MSSEHFPMRLQPIDVFGQINQDTYSEAEVATHSIMSDNGWAEYRSALSFDPHCLGSRVLDIGVGQNARFVFEARKKGLNVVGIAPFLTVDGKPQQAGLSHRHTTETNVVQAVATALPFANETFDTCLSLYALSYIAPHLVPESASRLYPEVLRVLKPGGRGYIGRYTKNEYKFARPSLLDLQARGVNVQTTLSHKWIDRRRYEPRYSVMLQKP